MFPRISIGGSNVNMTLLLCMISVNFLFSNSFKWQFKGEKLKKEKKFSVGWPSALSWRQSLWASLYIIYCILVMWSFKQSLLTYSSFNWKHKCYVANGNAEYLKQLCFVCDSDRRPKIATYPGSSIDMLTQ